MDSTKIDITSSMLEKGIDTAKNFLEKLILPAIEETGLLIKDHVTMWKFKKQVKMLNQAKAYCEKNNISPKTISLKLLCPILDYSGIEEDEVLQDKWAILLSNLVDSDQNIENHVFPYVLSQLSKNEFITLETSFDKRQIRVESLTLELLEFKNSKPVLEKELKERIAQIDIDIQQKKEDSSNQFHSYLYKLESLRRETVKQLDSMNYRESTLSYQINKPATIPIDSLKKFELSNVIRLGLVKEEKEFYTTPQTLEIPNERDRYSDYTNIKIDIEVESDTENILTELGELFINACKDKSQQSVLK